ncbi:hypothetical protein JOD55_000383 [Arcanobacterium pluranimalium]|uniref:hypothetical protein n=1 Tax=Arcanobacterium pluranimalium TaxID=108028 RepID=UPI00195AC016|nr:hypothetical protein [Arcanobacterium pluranimalium]MBM7824556.1 hypothetical protein [Arcanobacterium pluranimalium]
MSQIFNPKSPVVILISVIVGICAVFSAHLLHPAGETQAFTAANSAVSTAEQTGQDTAGKGASGTGTAGNGTPGAGTSGTGTKDAKPSQTPHKTPVVFIGFSGVQWSYVNPQNTPHLADFAGKAATANNVVRTLDTTTCPDDGWLTVNTGMRTTSARANGDSCALLPEPKATGQLGRTLAISNWADYVGVNESNAYNPKLGLFGEELRTAGKKVAAVGGGAALAIADKSGNVVGDYYAHIADMKGSLSQYDVVVIDLGAARHPNWPLGQQNHAGSVSELKAAFSQPAPAPAELLNQVKQIDQALGTVLSKIDPAATVLIASVADSDQITARMQYFATRSPQTEQIGTGALAHASSTRQAGIVQLTDVLPTLGQLLALPHTSSLTGSPIRYSVDERSAQERLTHLVDVEERATAVRPAVGPFYIIFSALAVLLLSWALILVRGHSARRRSHSLAMAYGLLSVAALPISTFLLNLVPWWRLPHAHLFLILFVMLLAALLGLIASVSMKMDVCAGAFVIATITATVLGVDAALGSPLHFSSIMGDQPQSGGRFYGISNAPFVLFATSILFMVGYLLDQMRKRLAPLWMRVVVLLAFAFFAIVIDGAPNIGADFGGPPALVVAFVLIGFLHAQRRMSWTSLLLIGTIAMAGMFGISYLDWRQPEEDWSHFGRFFDSVVSGDVFAVIARKFEWMTTSAPVFVWFIVIPLALGGTWLAFRRRATIADLITPTVSSSKNAISADLWIAFIAMIAMVFVGLLINDSGLVLPMMGILFGGSLWLAPAVAFHGANQAHDHANHEKN